MPLLGVENSRVLLAQPGSVVVGGRRQMPLEVAQRTMLALLAACRAHLLSERRQRVALAQGPYGLETVSPFGKPPSAR